MRGLSRVSSAGFGGAGSTRAGALGAVSSAATGCGTSGAASATAISPVVRASSTGWLGGGVLRGGLLVVSQFTLAADTAGGNRPGFSGAAPPALGRALYETVLRIARERPAPVAAGEFGADMQVELVNDGPVTIPLRIA